MKASQRIVAYSKASTVLDKDEKNDCVNLCWLVKFWLRLLIRSFFSKNQDEPILETYSADSTPTQTRQRYHLSYQDLIVRRSGKSTKHWLQQRYFVQNANNDTEVLFTEPVLLADQTAWSQYNSVYELTDMARQHHRGINVSHSCYDRAIQTAMFRKERQRHKAYDLLLEDTLGPGEAWHQIMMSWIVSCGCFAHDAHNAFKWSVCWAFNDKTLMRDAWICMESLRQSYDVLVTELPKWLGRVLRFEDVPGENLGKLWAWVGVKDHWLNVMVNIGLRWDSGYLKVNRDLEQDTGVIQLVTMILLHVWKFKSWSTSRWCGVLCGVQSARPSV